MVGQRYESREKEKITYQAYKGPVGELNVKSSFGKPKSASTSKKKKKSPYQDDDDLSKLLSSNGNMRIRIL